ncbi:MBL fold metallo-hydrolase [Spongiibacter marinus]|uniref:MBL fold metallo-hydrolase n=1 Tax=Spongiibacter marinus TaxID=354246 RepID=UPI003C547553
MLIQNHTAGRHQRCAVLLLISLTLAIVTPLHAETAKPAHHGESEFRNPYWPTFNKSLWELLRLRFFSDLTIADQASQRQRIRVVTEVADLHISPSAPLQVTWLGHSSFLLQYRGVAILTDPIFSRRASPVQWLGPERLVAQPIGPPQLPPIDVVIISHDHYDHLDERSIRALGNQPVYLVPLKLGDTLQDFGIAATRIVERDWWQTFQLDSLTATATPSQHWSGRGITDRFKSLWASWHLRIDDMQLWFGGDTGYNTEQFKSIGERFPGIDLALIPIGAYKPRSFLKEQHVDPAEAVQIHRDIGAAQSIGIHWATFQLSAEDIDAPQHDLRRAVEDAGLPPSSFDTMQIGETRQLMPSQISHP